MTQSAPEPNDKGLDIPQDDEHGQGVPVLYPTLFFAATVLLAAAVWFWNRGSAPAETEPMPHGVTPIVEQNPPPKYTSNPPAPIPAIDIGANADARALTPLSEYRGRIGHIVIHAPDEFIDRLWTPVGDLIKALPGDTRVSLVCNFDAACADLRAKLDEIELSKHPGVSIRYIDRPMLIWARDRYISTRPASPIGDLPVLLVPQLVHNFDAARRSAERQIPSLLNTFEPICNIAESSLILEGGNVLATGKHVLVGGNAITENATKTTPEQALSELSRTFRPRVLLVGDSTGLPPVGHIDMFITVVGEDHLLVGCPRTAERIMAGADHASREALDARLFITPDMPDPKGPDFTPARAERFDDVALSLNRAGYRVDRLPYADSRGGDFIVSYNNVIQETVGSERIVYMPVYGIEALDNAARKTYEEMGFRVAPIDVTPICHLLGAVRCMANVVDRR